MVESQRWPWRRKNDSSVVRGQIHIYTYIYIFRMLRQIVLLVAMPFATSSDALNSLVRGLFTDYIYIYIVISPSFSLSLYIYSHFPIFLSLSIYITIYM